MQAGGVKRRRRNQTNKTKKIENKTTVVYPPQKKTKQTKTKKVGFGGKIVTTEKEADSP